MSVHKKSFKIFKKIQQNLKNVWEIALFSKLSPRNSLKDHMDDYKDWS